MNPENETTIDRRKEITIPLSRKALRQVRSQIEALYIYGVTRHLSTTPHDESLLSADIVNLRINSGLNHSTATITIGGKNVEPNRRVARCEIDFNTPKARFFVGKKEVLGSFDGRKKDDETVDQLRLTWEALVDLLKDPFKRHNLFLEYIWFDEILPNGKIRKARDPERLKIDTQDQVNFEP